MFRKDKSKATRPPRELKNLPNQGKDSRVDFNICPYSPYGRFGIWFKTIFRF